KPVAGDQGGDSGPPGRAADPGGDARDPALAARRLVAVLGTIDDLAPRLGLEAVHQGVRTAVRVVWLSDGGRSLWSVFQRLFQAIRVTAILTFSNPDKNGKKVAAPGLNGAPGASRRWLPIYVPR